MVSISYGIDRKITHRVDNNLLEGSSFHTPTLITLELLLPNCSAGRTGTPLFRHHVPPSWFT